MHCDHSGFLLRLLNCEECYAMFTDATSLDEILILNISVIVYSFLPCNCSQSNSENLNLFHLVTFKSESDEEEKKS